ncbi:CpsD/CapB family tyrosine-protein kinase [Isoptericola cucumis]|uniref:polysaccharide biosynthesis tyrosine autokinase n=1 Tax=Isoptericola cucumis TaxID=1776856 RepID=UPI0032089B7B
MTVRDFLRTLWAGKYLIVAAVLVVVAGTAVYLQRAVPVYESTATVQIRSSPAVGSEGESEVVTVDADPELVSSPEVLGAAAHALGDGTSAATLGGVTEVSFVPEAATMSVTVQGADPAAAAARADAVAAAYVAALPAVLEADVAALDARADALRDQLGDVQAVLRESRNDPLATAERTSIVEQYQGLVTQRSALTSIGKPAVVLEAAPPGERVGLPPTVLLALAALAGLVAGIGLALARRGLDVTVRTPGDTAEIAAVPVLADLYGVPAADREFRRSAKLPVTSRHATPFTESIRELRTAVRVSLGDEPHKVVVVTASDPHAPRAFIAANLAASFALSGRPTVVLAGDLRRAELPELLPAGGHDDGERAGDDAEDGGLRPTRVPNLRVMTIQDNTMDPADYLATTQVRAVVERLRREAAVVVIDAPPVLAAADATILGGYADGVVLVATAGKTAREVLREAADRLRINHVPLVGVALAGVKGDRRMLYASTYGIDRTVDGSPDPADDTAGAALDPDEEPRPGDDGSDAAAAGARSDDTEQPWPVGR